MNDREKLIRKLDIWFSKYIRLRDVGENGYFRCISCQRVLSYEYMDCGHYIPRTNMATRFDEKNCNGQCVTCNRIKLGNSREYRAGMLLKYGGADVLVLEARKNAMKSWSRYELEGLIEYYKQEVKRLRKQKPLVRI